MIGTQIRIWLTLMLVAAIIACISGRAAAQNPPQNSASPASPTTPQATSQITDNNVPGQITSPTYQISVEDTLQVTVATLDGFGPMVAERLLTVLDDGTADVPYLGETKIVGLTIGDLKAKIRKAVAKNIERPAVTVSVRSRYQKIVNIFGPLANRGKLPLRDNWHVRDVIAAAGGLPTDRYDFLEASLLRRSGEIIPIDLQRLLADKDPSQNLLVEADDTLFIRELDPSRTQIQVIGQVNRPGPVLMPRSRSIVDVLQTAGGPTERASLSQVTIERDGKSIVVDMSNYRKTGFEPAEKLQMGDRLVVPENKREYYIFGVERGGVQPYPEDRKITVSQALAIGGGRVQGSEVKKVRLTRPNPDGSTKMTATVDVEKMLKTGDFSKDVVVEPGDTIYVPASGRRRGVSIQEVLGYFTGFYTLQSIFRRF